MRTAKQWRGAAALLLVLLVLLALAGCGRDGDAGDQEAIDPDATVVGRWVWTEVVWEGEPITMTALAQMMGEDVSLTLILREDGSALVEIPSGRREGSYTLNGRQVSVEADSWAESFLWDGGERMTIEQEELLATLTRDASYDPNRPVSVADYVGYWVIDGAVINGQTLSRNELARQLGADAMPDDLWFEIRANGFLWMGDSASEEEYTFTLKEDCLEFDSPPTRMVIVGDKLHFEVSDVYTLVFARGNINDLQAIRDAMEQDDVELVGRWVAVEVETSGMTISLDEMAEFTDIDLTMIFEFRADGTVTGSLTGYSTDGSYVVRDDGIHITMDGETEILTLENGRLVYDTGEGRMLFDQEEPGTANTTSNSSISGDIVGVWTTTEVDVDGAIVTMQEINDAVDMDLTMVFEFRADGTVAGDMMGLNVEGTYQLRGNDVDITFDGDTETFTLENGKLIYDVGMGKLILTK